MLNTKYNFDELIERRSSDSFKWNYDDTMQPINEKYCRVGC